jgi:hypothetical protein
MNAVVFNPISIGKHKDKEVQAILDGLQKELNSRMSLLNKLTRDLESKQKIGDQTVTNNITIKDSVSLNKSLNTTQVVVQRVTTAGYQAVVFVQPYEDSNYAAMPILVRDDASVGFASPLVNASDGTYGDTRKPSGLGVYCDDTGILMTITGRSV